MKYLQADIFMGASAPSVWQADDGWRVVTNSLITVRRLPCNSGIYSLFQWIGVDRRWPRQLKIKWNNKLYQWLSPEKIHSIIDVQQLGQWKFLLINKIWFHLDKITEPKPNTSQSSLYNYRTFTGHSPVPSQVDKLLFHVTGSNFILSGPHQFSERGCNPSKTMLCTGLIIT